MFVWFITGTTMPVYTSSRILTKLGTYLVLKRIWNPIDLIFKVIGQRSRSPGQIFRRGDTPRFALPLFKVQSIQDSGLFWVWFRRVSLYKDFFYIIYRFGTHVSGVAPINRSMRINNISPYGKYCNNIGSK